MLHPAVARALVTARIEDLHRAAARRQTIRLALRVAHERHETAAPIAMVRPQADGMTPTEIVMPEASVGP
jgi:hypothetical protein